MPDTRNPATNPSRSAPTRADLLARWTAARRRRDAALLGGVDFRQATMEVGELEVAINALDVEAAARRDEPVQQPGPGHS